MILKVRDLTDIAEIIGRERQSILDTVPNPGPALEQLLSHYDELIGKVLAEEEYYRKLEHKPL